MSEVRVKDEAGMIELGERLAGRLSGGDVIELSGDLGAGKTTLVRGMLRGLGFAGRVKSPSYGLVESYRVAGLEVHHLDLYRLSEPEELDFLGIEELTGPESVLLIEWPDRGRGRLPTASARIAIAHAGRERRVAIDRHPDSNLNRNPDSDPDTDPAA